MTAAQDRGWVTETGRVVRRTVAAVDPGLRRQGVRFDLAGDLIVGRVSYAERTLTLPAHNVVAPGRTSLMVREWIVEAVEGSHDRRSFLRSTAGTRGDAVHQFMQALGWWQGNPPAREAAAEENRRGRHLRAV